MEFASSLGFWALLSLIPFIILYMRRPRPQDRIIPSLMFLLRDKKDSKRYAMLKKFLMNLLFFLQLAILIGLAVTLARPFTKLNYDVSLENTVIVLDASASMKADSGARFNDAVKEAKSALSGRNSIILAENVPLVLLEEEEQDVAMDILNSLKPKDTTTNLGDAILLGKDMLGDNPGRIVVISDFAGVDLKDLLVVKTAVETDDRIVSFVDINGDTDNAGIVNLEVRKYSIKAFIKNFDKKEKTVKLVLYQGDKALAQSGSIKILPNSIESFIFDGTPAGISRIEIEPKDDFPADDTAYISAPLKKQVSVLLITNKKNSNIETALRASKDIALNVVNPPVLTINTEGNKVEPYKQDVIIVNQINNVNQREGILPGTFKDIKSFAENGGKLVLTAQEDIDKFELEDTSAASFKGMAGSGGKVCTGITNQITKQFESEPCFSTLGKYFNAEPAVGALTVASVGDTPIMALKGMKKGQSFYYGIMDDYSDFKSLPSYPVFWNSLINFLAETEDIKDFNIKTGKIAAIEEQRVKTPSGSTVTSKVIFDEAGVYEIAGKSYAANLIDAKESDINLREELEDADSVSKALETEARQKSLSLEVPILIAVLLLMLLEIAYIKRRGDL